MDINESDVARRHTVNSDVPGSGSNVIDWKQKPLVPHRKTSTLENQLSQVFFNIDWST